MASNVKTAAQILQDKGGQLYTVGEEATVLEALQLMVDSKVGSVLVKKGSRLVGIYTERDLIRNTIDPQFDAATTRIGDVMTRGLQYAPHTDSAYELMDKFLGLRLRHLLIEQGGQFLGLLSIGDVVRASLRERTQQFEELKEVVNWQYYDEWKPRM